MKSFAAAIVLIAFCASAFQTANAFRSAEMVEAVIDQQGQNGILESLSSLLGGSVTTDRKAYVLIKYIVVPSKARGFIEEVEVAKKGAEKEEGYVAYNLVKTLDDNITYYAWAEWESPKDLIDYLKSESARKLIEYTAKEDIVTLVSGVRPLV